MMARTLERMLSLEMFYHRKLPSGGYWTSPSFYIPLTSWMYRAPILSSFYLFLCMPTAGVDRVPLSISMILSSHSALVLPVHVSISGNEFLSNFYGESELEVYRGTFYPSISASFLSLLLLFRWWPLTPISTNSYKWKSRRTFVSANGLMESINLFR